MSMVHTGAVFFEDDKAFETWLVDNAATATHAWIRMAKKGSVDARWRLWRESIGEAQILPERQPGKQGTQMAAGLLPTPASLRTSNA